MAFAEVAVEVSHGGDNETFTYLVPEGLECRPGQRVRVPFGRRLLTGFVVSVGETRRREGELRSLEVVEGEPLLPAHLMELAPRVADHYWAPLIEVVRAMLPPRVRSRSVSAALPSSRQRRFSRLLQLASGQAPAPPALGPEEAKALDAFWESPRSLVVGRATPLARLYAAAAERTLARGEGVLLLVPEVSLTPQLVERVARSLGVRPAILHSSLSELERAQQWWRVRRGEVRLVIGSRSAIFAPLVRPGLIVVDDEGSGAYKQDRTPRYEVSWVAEQLSRLTGARLLFGSATPSVATYARSLAGEIGLQRLPSPAGRRPAPQVVDMTEEPSASPLSRALVKAVDEALGEGGQAVLLLNRRGLSTLVVCRGCTAAILCPNCSVSLVQHPELGGLHCHYCGFTQGLPELCPSCGKALLRGLGVGTQRLQALAQRRFPNARVVRLDSDLGRRQEAYLEVLQQFERRQADLVVGTQLVAPLLEASSVRAVGVVDADLALRFPDYRAAETTFQFLTQAIGRSPAGARVVVQTRNPGHYAIQAAVAGALDQFCRRELESRSRFGFPPSTELAVLTFSDPDSERAAQGAEAGAFALRSRLEREGVEGVSVSGPSPHFIHRLRGEWRWQVTVRGQHLERVRPLIPRGRGWSADVDPRG